MTIKFGKRYKVNADGVEKILTIKRELEISPGTFICILWNLEGTHFENALLTKAQLREMFELKKREKLQIE